MLGACERRPGRLMPQRIDLLVEQNDSLVGIASVQVRL
jgi:hypothetical protein